VPGIAELPVNSAATIARVTSDGQLNVTTVGSLFVSSCDTPVNVCRRASSSAYDKTITCSG